MTSRGQTRLASDHLKFPARPVSMTYWQSHRLGQRPAASGGEVPSEDHDYSDQRPVLPMVVITAGLGQRTALSRSPQLVRWRSGDLLVGRVVDEHRGERVPT